MSEIPALRDALVDAAARRVRRRRRFVLRLTAWTAVAAAMAAVVAIVVSHPAERELPVTPPPAVPTATPTALERAFPAFARAGTAADRLPASDAKTLFSITGMDSRLVLDTAADRVWLATGTRAGVPLLCWHWVASDGGNDGCEKLAAVEDATAASGALRRTTALLVLSSAARDVRMRLADGTVLSPALHDGVAVVTRRGQIADSAWTAPSGARSIARYVLPAAHVPDLHCPKLDPLPAGAAAQARRAALEAVDAIYPQAIEAKATSVAALGPGLCSRAVSSRTLVVSLHLVPLDPSQRKSASLTQGRLLLGMLGGRMTVWSVQH